MGLVNPGHCTAEASTKGLPSKPAHVGMTSILHVPHRNLMDNRHLVVCLMTCLWVSCANRVPTLSRRAAMTLLAVAFSSCWLEVRSRGPNRSRSRAMTLPFKLILQQRQFFPL